MEGNVIKAKALSKKISVRAVPVCSALAPITGEIVATAVPPHIAVPELINCADLLPFLSIRPSKRPIPMVKIT